MKNKNSRNYIIKDTFRAGLVLRGNVIKAIVSGEANINTSHLYFHDNKIILAGMYVPEKWATHEPIYVLLNKHEINKIKKSGLSIIPLELVNSHDKKNRWKLMLGIGKPAKNYDKRAKERQREDEKCMRSLS